MKPKLIVAVFLAATFAFQMANACHIFVTVSCPNNGNSAAGIDDATEAPDDVTFDLV